MQVFLPTLESNIKALVGTLQFIVFAIMVVGLIVYAASPRTTGMSLLVPIAKAVLIVTAIAYMDQWFPMLDTSFLQVADAVDPGYSTNPTAAAESVRSSTATNPNSQPWSWRHLNQSIYQAVTDAIANILVYVGTLITVPMLILQYVLRWVLYLLTPFALALILVPGFSGISVRFFQQVLAIHAWPVGFAMTNMMALSIWQEFRSAVGANPQTVTDAVVYSPLLTFTGALLGAIMIVVGMISTPIVMQALFAQGHAFTGSSGNPATIFRTATSAIYGYRSLRGGAAPLASAVSRANPKPPSSPPPAGADSRPGI